MPLNQLELAPVDMKNNPLITILLGVLTVSALASIVLCWLFISNTRKVNTLRVEVGRVITTRNFVNALANDAVEYSKKNPSIEPILHSVGVHKPGATTATSKSATK